MVRLPWSSVRSPMLFANILEPHSQVTVFVSLADTRRFAASSARKSCVDPRAKRITVKEKARRFALMLNVLLRRVLLVRPVAGVRNVAAVASIGNIAGYRFHWVAPAVFGICLGTASNPTRLGERGSTP